MPIAPRSPGVYVEEISMLPPSVAEVATAIPAFIGYTERGPAEGVAPIVARVSSMLEFTTAFGGPQRERFTITATGDTAVVAARVEPTTNFSLYYALRLYFANGGGPCYVVSIGSYASTPAPAAFSAGLAALAKEDEPTLIVLSDAAAVLTATNYYALCTEALAQCASLADRFTILDVHRNDVAGFRGSSSLAGNLLYGAAYYPYLRTTIAYEYADASVTVTKVGGTAVPVPASGKVDVGPVSGLSISYSGVSGNTPAVVVTVGANTGPTFTIADGTLTIGDISGMAAKDVVAAWTTWKASNEAAGFDITTRGQGVSTFASDIARTAIPLTSPPPATDTLDSIKGTQTSLYNRARAVLDDMRVVLPPSPAIAGIYARVDREQGVWKAPANVPVMAVIGPDTKITNADQDGLNVDPNAGKSINAIRDFTGRGTLVWGARTLAGNDNEWRYVPVRRLFITIEESARKASAFAVFEPNDQGTWLKVKAMIESYLYGLWERGALAGSKPEAAYYVHVGLNATMTPQDVLEGRMIVEIGVAAVRPAEFIVLRFSHKLQTA